MTFFLLLGIFPPRRRRNGDAINLKRTRTVNRCHLGKAADHRRWEKYKKWTPKLVSPHPAFLRVLAELIELDFEFFDTADRLADLFQKKSRRPAILPGLLLLG